MSAERESTKLDKQEWAEGVLDLLVKSNFTGKLVLNMDNGSVARCIQERVATPPKTVKVGRGRRG